jgi:hypothetical protein
VYTVQGMDPQYTVGRFGMGLTTDTKRGLEFSVRYDIEVRDGYENQMATFRFKRTF